MAGGGNGAAQAPESHYSSVVNTSTYCSCKDTFFIRKCGVNYHCTIWTQFAFAYIFNLVIGVGALALPLAFSDAGLVLGTLLIIILAFMSFMTTSYVIEAMAAANAYDIFKERSEQRKLSHQNSDIQKADMVCLFHMKLHFID